MKQIWTEYGNGIGKMDKYGLCKHIISFLKRYNVDGVNYVCDGQRTGLFIYYPVTRYLREVPQKVMSKYCLINDVKFERLSECCKVAYEKRPAAWKPQSLIGRIGSSLESLISFFTTIRNNAHTFVSLEFRLLLIDILALIIEVRDGFLTFGKFFSVLLRLYTTYKRFHTMNPQTLGISDIIVGFGMLGLPAGILERIKTFTALTGQRVFDSDLMATLLAKFFTLIRDIVAHFEGHTAFGGPCKYILTFLDWCCSNFLDYGLMSEVVAIYTTWIRTPQIIFDPSFRERVVNHYAKCVESKTFLAYADNVRNRHFNVTWGLFKESLLKSVKAFDASRRKEPICFVFEGGAGSGKSTFMNNVVDLLRAAGKSVYCHTVPSTEDAKDFYDDYENQEVFVMDDVGQQGKSQWRTLINFVSPVKYPLPCANASKKNTKFFSSDIILCTTNHFMDLGGFTSADCITEPEALFRRVHLITVDAANDNGQFLQRFQYWKYDHRFDHRWKRELLFHNADPEIPLQYTGSMAEFSLEWFYRIFCHVERRETENMSDTRLPSAVFDRIITRQEKYEFQSVFADMCAGLKDGSVIFKEWLKHILGNLTKYVEWMASMLCSVVGALMSGQMQLVVKLPSFVDLDEREVTIPIGTLVVMSLTVIGVSYLCLRHCGENDVEGEQATWEAEKAFNKAVKDSTGMDSFNRSQDSIWVRTRQQNEFTFEAQTAERLDAIRKFLKTAIIKKDQHDRSMDEETQCVVSGKYIILPSHIDCANVKVDLYHSYDHYKNNHVEMENVTIKLVKSYFTCDLAVYAIQDAIPLYKKCWNLFAQSNQRNPNMYIANSMGYFPVVLGGSVVPNSESVKYSRYMLDGKKEYEHEPNTGIITPLTGAGLCGTVIVSSGHGIIGYHVAGNHANGFCVVPPRHIADEIRDIVLSGSENPFEVDDKVIPNFSGVRLRYNEGDVEIAKVIGGTSFVPTIFHKSCNEDIKQLCEHITPELTIAPVEEVGDKIPPIFGEKPRKLMADISKKTFKRQGFITSAERAFIGDVISKMMIPFDDISDEECAFGGEYVGPLNKDSSNGYGCMTGKESYFDFANKVIKPEAYELFSKISQEANDDNYDYSHFMSRETFKDELRKLEKADTPRTFRVMPLGHIWWTKKIFGKLINHFRTNMHEYGCCVGLNPYMDFGEIYERLSTCKVTGDIDFKQWDGSVMSDIMMTIFEEFSKYYKGVHKNELRYVARTSTFSYVLVGDAVWATTHGLPSGTWLTLLINCLINKAITALTMYRNKPDCTVDDVFALVDYVMGDDKIFGAPAGYEKYFNLKTINEVATSLGMTCTNGDKTPITSTHQPLDKLTFVKRHMRKHPQLERIVGVLSLETILNTLQWYDSTKDVEQVMEGKMRAVQIEAYLHSKLLFERLTSIMRKYYPFTPLFQEPQVKSILRDRAAYVKVMEWLGKDMRFIEGGSLNNSC